MQERLMTIPDSQGLFERNRHKEMLSYAIRRRIKLEKDFISFSSVAAVNELNWQKKLLDRHITVLIQRAKNDPELLNYTKNLLSELKNLLPAIRKNDKRTP